MSLSLLATQYSVDKQALEIYFAGCRPPNCPGCHNPESWDFKNGREVDAEGLLWMVNQKIKSGVVKNIMLLGGEPLDQPASELVPFVQGLRETKLPIWLFTKFEIYDIPFGLRIKFNYIKTGRYIEELKTDDLVVEGIKLASSNQKVLVRGRDY